MPFSMLVVKGQDGALHPASAADQVQLAKLKVGQAVRVDITRASPRSLEHHRLYWGGLIELAFDYWEPKGGLVASSELSTLKRFADWLDRKGNNSGAVRRACRAFVVELREMRMGKIETPEKSREALHDWIKIEAGYFHYEITPTGMRKVPVSINFYSMDQDAFNLYYKAAFSVVWRFILSRTFSSEAEAENAINQLLAMG